MFHLTLMPNIKHLFEGFSILKKNEDGVENLYNFPSTYSLNVYYDFIFPCDCPKEKTEEYTIVISSSNNSRSFLVCRYSDYHKIYLCIYSYNPWFEILSKILLDLCSNEFMKNQYDISNYLSQIYILDHKDYVTLPSYNLNDKTPKEFLKNTLQYPFIYDKYIQEYLTAIQPTAKYNKQLWIEVFWSMLLERPVIFMSKRYQKLTSSLMAAIFFIHPLSWLHKIVSIIPKKSPELLGMNCCMLGIHNCMEPKLAKAEYWNEALLVDLDKGESRMVGGCENEKETAKRFKVPKYIKKFFSDNLSMVDDSISKHSPPRIKNLISNIPWEIANKEEKMYNEYKKGFHIYSLLFRTVIAILIGHYRECISENGGKYQFDKNKFISKNEKITEFLQLLINSQCFDSFIDERLKKMEHNEEIIDRFDRERLELNFNDKSRTKNTLDLIQKKLITVIGTKSEENIARKEKISTMPNLKKKIIPKNTPQKKTSFYLETGVKSKSISSSTSSLNDIHSTNKKKDSSGSISTQSDSLTNQVYKGLIERNIILPDSLPNRSFLVTPYSSQDQDKNTGSSKIDSTNQNKPTFVLRKVPERPSLPPTPKCANGPKDLKIPAGKVKDIIQQISNKNNDNYNRVSKDNRILQSKELSVCPARQRSSSLFQIPTAITDNNDII